MAIIYQLPNGKCVHISIEQLLELDDEDIQFMIANDMGYHGNNPNRKLKYPDKDSTPQEEYDEYYLDPDFSPDMLSDGDDVDFDDIDLDNIPDS